MQKRCGMCGAEIRAQHLGNVKIGDADVAIGYCERCNASAVPIGDGEKPYRERMAEARLRVPKGWSRRQCADGSLELKRGVPCRWLWAFAIGLVVLFASALSAGRFMHVGDMDLHRLVFLAAFAGVGALAMLLFASLFRLTARRYRLGRDALVVESLWLGFMPMCSRRFARTEITSGGVHEQGKDCVAFWANGYDRREFWRGRSKDEAEFIDANLLAPGVADAANAEPLLCGKCGAEFKSEDIDLRSDSLVCRMCGSATDIGSAEYARMVRFRMKLRPQGVVEIPGGFELREGRWWNGELRSALSRYAFAAFIVVPLARIFEKLPAPWVYVPLSILLLGVAAAPVYFAVAAIVGRYGVRRITAQGGNVAYFHGIGRLGRRWVLPLDSIGDVGVTYRGSVIDQNASIPNAFAMCVKGEWKVKRIFRDCPPIFYHWIEGWFRETLKDSNVQLSSIHYPVSNEGGGKLDIG